MINNVVCSSVTYSKSLIAKENYEWKPHCNSIHITVLADGLARVCSWAVTAHVGSERHNDDDLQFALMTVTHLAASLITYKQLNYLGPWLKSAANLGIRRTTIASFLQNHIMDCLYIPVITLHLSIVAKNTFYCNDHTITEFGITDKNSSTAYVILYELIDTWLLDSNRRVRVWSLPWRWHILSIPLTTGRGTSAETCWLDDVFPPDDLGSRPEALC